MRLHRVFGPLTLSTVEATMSKGVLKITIPKPTRNETKKIDVKEAA